MVVRTSNRVRKLPNKFSNDEDSVDESPRVRLLLLPCPTQPVLSPFARSSPGRMQTQTALSMFIVVLAAACESRLCVTGDLVYTPTQDVRP